MSTENSKLNAVAKSVANSKPVQSAKTKAAKVWKVILTCLTIVGLLALVITGYGFIKYVWGPRPAEENAEIKTAEVVLPLAEPEIDYKLGERVTEAMNSAHSAAYFYASKEIDFWIAEVMQRADDNFLDSYFSYAQQKLRGGKAFFHNMVHLFNGNHPTAQQAAMNELEDMISTKVIVPEVSQKRINNIMAGTVQVYETTLGSELTRIQAQYQIPELIWDQYIRDVCGLTISAEGKTIPVAMKTTVLSSIAFVGVSTSLAAPAIKKVIAKIGTKKATDVAATSIAAESASFAGKAVGTAVSKLTIAGACVSAGLLIWDIVDTCKTNAEGKRQLRSNLESYFAEVKVELLGNTSDSIMGCLTDWENNVKKKMASAE